MCGISLTSVVALLGVWNGVSVCMLTVSTHAFATRYDYARLAGSNVSKLILPFFVRSQPTIVRE